MKHNTRKGNWRQDTTDSSSSSSQTDSVPTDNNDAPELVTDGGLMTADQESSSFTLTEDGFAATRDHIYDIEERATLLTTILLDALDIASAEELNNANDHIRHIEDTLDELDADISVLIKALSDATNGAAIDDYDLPEDADADHLSDTLFTLLTEGHEPEPVSDSDPPAVEPLLPPTDIDTELFGVHPDIGTHANTPNGTVPDTENIPSVSVLGPFTPTTQLGEDGFTTVETSTDTDTDVDNNTESEPATESTPTPGDNSETEADTDRTQTTIAESAAAAESPTKTETDTSRPGETRETQAGGNVKVRQKPPVETPEDETESDVEAEATPDSDSGVTGALYGGRSADTSGSTDVHVAKDDTVEYEDCPECGGRLMAPSPSETCCEDCGLVVQSESIDHGPEWRAFDNSEYESKSRVGGPTTNTMHDKGLSTTISWEDKDAYGNPLSSRKRKQLKRLRKWDERCRAKDSSERNLMQALGEVQRLTSELNLPENCEETASVIYRRALDEDLIQGRSIESMATASLYAAARQAGYPRTIDQVCEYSRVSKKRVSRAFSYIVRELGLEVQPPNVIDYLPKAISKLNVTEETKHTAEDLLETGVEANLHSGKAPAGMAAAAVYAATLINDTNDKVTQDDASDVGDVCALTIRTRYRELLRASGYDPEEVQPDNTPPGTNTSNDDTDSDAAADTEQEVLTAD